MQRHIKPILYNGYKIKSDLLVVNRVDRVFFTEVYMLSNGQHLYLFTNIKQDEVLDRQSKYNTLLLTIEPNEYLGLIVDDHSNQNLSTIIDKLTVLRGFDCVAGMNELKELLIRDVINPILQPNKYLKFRLSIPNGILLYGPPGCGKTFIVKKLAEELGFNFIELNPSTVASPFIHGAVGGIAKIFEIAKMQTPSIIFIDEIEGLIPKREDLGSHADTKKEEINEFLLQLNNAGDNKILVVGATNRPHIIDLALLRSGRMDKRVYVGPPDFEARKQMFKICLSGRPFDQKIDFIKLATLTTNYVSSDLELIVTESARLAVNRDKNLIDEDLIIEAINKFSPSISDEEILYYDQFINLNRS
jgi:transitional endoplasmic reticulum ATPase